MRRSTLKQSLIFPWRAIRRPRLSEQVYFENQLAYAVARPLFEAGIEIAAITERKQYGIPKEGGEFNARHCHELVLLLQGKLQVKFNDETHDLTPGDLAVAPTGNPVGYFYRGTPTWFLYFGIADRPAWAPFKRHGPYVRPCETAALLFLLLRGILDAHHSHQPPAVAQALENSRTLVHLLRLEMLRTEGQGSTQHARVRELLSDVTAAPGRAWTRGTMATRLRVSVSRLTLLFREELGVSPGYMVIQQRMKHAAHLLLNTDQKIEAIARESGYESLHSFTRLFTRHIGMPPGQYRARHRPDARRP